MRPIRNAEELGAALTRARERAGMSKAAVGLELGTTGQRIGDYERGRLTANGRTLIRHLEVVGCGLVVTPLNETAPETALRSTETPQKSSAGIPGPLKAAAGESGASTAIECWHCGSPRRGYATAAGMPLCHDDTGPNCYRLVMIHNHPMPCDCTKEA